MTEKIEETLIIECWYRTNMVDSSISIADISIADIVNIVIVYLKLRKLKFSKEWMSKDSFILMHDNTMAMKTIKGDKWILPDIEPVKEGKVCWRVKV